MPGYLVYQSIIVGADGNTSERGYTNKSPAATVHDSMNLETTLCTFADSFQFFLRVYTENNFRKTIIQPISLGCFKVTNRVARIVVVFRFKPSREECHRGVSDLCR